MNTLRTRGKLPELMAQPGVDDRDFLAALHGLRRLNRAARAAHVLWPDVLAQARLHAPNQPLRLLDVACGAGDIPLALWRRADRAGIPLEIHGCDFEPRAITFATQEAEKAGAPLRFFRHDAVNDPLPNDYDLITSSLFLHHLPEDHAVRFLESARKAARHAVIIHDLARGLPGYLLAWAAVRLLTQSRICRIDGPRSVENAFTPDEARHLALRAGMKDVIVQKRFPCRFVLLWKVHE